MSNDVSEDMAKTVDPFEVPMVFFRVGWMEEYKGVSSTDQITGGGKFVKDNAFGFEIFNFRSEDDENVYGWVMPGSKSPRTERTPDFLQAVADDDFCKVNLRKLGAESNDRSLEDVLVVWVATSPEGGAYVVGWYQHATVFQSPQLAPKDSNRRHKGVDIGFVTSAKKSEAFVVPIDERNIQVPQSGKGNFGQSNMWYANDSNNPIQRELRQAVIDAIQEEELPKPERRSPRQLPRQHDVLKRQEVERIAIETTADYYRQLGYEVKSVEQDNVGWDLEATLDNRKLRLEVKGLSGSEINVELTPNEYAKMQEYRTTYRLCVVTSSLDKPCLSVFRYSAESGQWESKVGRPLKINELISAKCTASRLEEK